MIQKIQQAIGNFPIIFIHQTGSQVFCSNCHDIDYVVVVDNWDKQFQQIAIDGVDYFCYSKQCFERWTTLSDELHRNVYAVALLLGSTVYGQNPIANYNWYDYAKLAVSQVVSRFSSQLRGKVYHKTNGQKVCSKYLCWAFATYFVVTNGIGAFTPAQRDILQKCHDGILPLSYASDLRQKLVALCQ